MEWAHLRRRSFVRSGLIGVLGFMLGSPARGALENLLSTLNRSNHFENPGNFRKIFKNSDFPAAKEEFLLFLTHVYHIYPERDFFSLISQLTEKYTTDAEIYQAILIRLPEVKPFLCELTYAVPALSTQKKELADQSMEFLSRRNGLDGYLEIGSPGRYVSELRKRIEIKGDLILVDSNEPGYSPLDVLERGQITKIGRYIPLNDYDPIPGTLVRDASLEVVTNFIGFHHSPMEKLDPFVRSIHRILKPGASLLLRDHDVYNEKMNHMVALAHDVFNAGLNAPWSRNHAELRNFRSLSDWIVFLKERGFTYQGRQLFQKGDPTRNALMEFVRS